MSRSIYYVKAGRGAAVFVLPKRFVDFHQGIIATFTKYCRIFSFSTAFVGILRGQLPSSGLILHNIDMIYVHRKRKYSFLKRFNVIVYIHALYTC